jgi:hypothetical protein
MSTTRRCFVNIGQCRPVEVARGGGCLIVDQANEDMLASAIKKSLADSETYERLVAEASAREFGSGPAISTDS